MCLLHPNSLHLSVRWTKRVFCMRAHVMWVGSWTFHCCFYSYHPFYSPKEEFYYLVSGLTFSFWNFYLFHLQPLNNSLSILISCGQQPLHCAELLRNKIDALWHGGLQLQHAGPQLSSFPQRNKKQRCWTCFPNLIVKSLCTFLV